jgi:TRAP-type C4-dicarboxylate transport system permease small subunit
VTVASSSLDAVAHAVRVAAGILLVGVAAAMVATILGRYVGFPTAWADEAARIAFVWSACLGAASGIHRGIHFAVQLIGAKNSGMSKRLLETAIAIVVIGTCALLLWATTTSIPVATRARLPALGVSGAWFHWAIVAFASLTMVFMIGHVGRAWRTR